MVKNYLVFTPNVFPSLLRTIESVDKIIPPDIKYIEIDQELWDHLEANREEIKLYELTAEGHLHKMTPEQFEEIKGLK